jgi:antitoxin (DNA-binding transcriptional repressor) of toxin-antitoxin stability system
VRVSPTEKGGAVMKFITIRDLRQSTKSLKSMMRKNKRLVLTSNGKPVALITPVDDKTLDEKLSIIDQTELMTALDQVRREAKEKGLDKLSMKEIDSIIAEVRRERRESRAGK